MEAEIAVDHHLAAALSKVGFKGGSESNLRSTVPYLPSRVVGALASTRQHAVLPAARPLGFTPEFSASPAKQTQWRAFLRKSGLEADASLQDVVNALNEFLMPVVEGILRKRTIPSLWRPGGPWKVSPLD